MKSRSQWLRRFVKSGPCYILWANVGIAIVLLVIFFLVGLISDHFKGAKINVGIFAVIMTPTILVLPTLVARFYLDLKYRKNPEKWDNGLYEKVIIGNVLVYVVLFLLLTTCKERKYSFPDNIQHYWETY